MQNNVNIYFVYYVNLGDLTRTNNGRNLVPTTAKDR